MGISVPAAGDPRLKWAMNRRSNTHILKHFMSGNIIYPTHIIMSRYPFEAANVVKRNLPGLPIPTSPHLHVTERPGSQYRYVPAVDRRYGERPLGPAGANLEAGCSVL